MSEKLAFYMSLEECEVLLWALNGCEDMLPGRYAEVAMDLALNLDSHVALHCDLDPALEPIGYPQHEPD